MPIPYMGNSLKGWTHTATVGIITQTVVNYQTVETVEEYTAKITMQPLSSYNINKKPEEQRAWIWWALVVVKPEFALKANDVITINSVRYRVQSGKDWKESGFLTCEIVEDFT